MLRGCEEPCGSPRVRTMSGSRVPPLLSRLSETSSADESMSDLDSVPCSPLILPCSPPAAPGSLGMNTLMTYCMWLWMNTEACNRKQLLHFTGLSFTGMNEDERLHNNSTGEHRVSIVKVFVPTFNRNVKCKRSCKYIEAIIICHVNTVAAYSLLNAVCKM